MANLEHLEILKQGVQVWNNWKKDNRRLQPFSVFGAHRTIFDFSGADLSRANLSGANLSEANFNKAKLIDADLRGANLLGANLSEADLRGARINEANLNEAILNEAKLIEADLREAHLLRAKLIEADLREADLSGAILVGADLQEANICNADLSRVHLERANLSGADFRGAKLIGSNLDGADLSGANICKADLSWVRLADANLNGAYFRGAKLIESNLRRSDLRGTDLREADLSGTDLSGADLRDANLRSAILNKTIFEDLILGSTQFSAIDLSQTVSLETVHHHGPSHIDIHTIYKSKGNIPYAFLRGCGVPDTLIEFIGSLVGHAIEYFSCFISYAHQDQPLAQLLHADLQNNGVRCWFAPHDLRIGEKYGSRIDEAIRLHDKLLLILSENSVTSDWVQREVESALKKERQTEELSLFPISIDDTVLRRDTGWAGHIRQERHIGDFQNWKDHDTYQQVFNRLLNDLKTDRKAPPVTPIFTTPNQQTTDLVTFIQSHFNQPELEDLYHFVDVPYNDVPGQTVPEKARELVAYFNRHRPGGAATLTDYLKAKRPNLFTNP